MRIIDTIPVLEEDTRRRVLVPPARVILTCGRVEGADALLQPGELQIRLREDATVRMENRDGGERAAVLLDYGRELHGGVRLLNWQAAGASYPRVRLCFGESVGEALSGLGQKNAGNDHALRDFTVPLPALSDQTFGETGFRFLLIELVEEEASIQLKSAPAVFVYRDVPYRGSFRCSDARLNAIYDTAAYTCHLCLQNRLWDGIKRDRLVWIGDTHPEMLAIRALFGREPLLEQSLDTACGEAALPGWMNGMPAYSMWWLLILRDWYQYTGDKAFPAKHREYIRALTAQILRQVEPDGRLALDDYFLDWSTHGMPEARAGVQALAALSMDAAAVLCRLLEDEDTARRAQRGAAALRAYGGDGGSIKPAAALLALAGMLPPERAGEILRLDGPRGLSTFMSYYILRGAAAGGHMTQALDMLRAYYGAMLDLGATTFWEDFDLDWACKASPIDRLPYPGESDVHGDNGAHCYSGFRHSLCHGWSAGPVPFLAEAVLGVELAAPGGTDIRLRPQLGDLDWAEGSYPLPAGDLHVRHRRNADGSVQTSFEAPAGVRVTVEG